MGSILTGGSPEGTAVLLEVEVLCRLLRNPGRDRPGPNGSGTTANSSQSRANQGTSQKPDLGPAGQDRAAAKDIETTGFDPIQNRQAAPREQIDIDGQHTGNLRREGTPLVEQRTRSLDLELHQLGESRREPVRPQVELGIAESVTILARQVDSADGQVAADVLPEVCQLRRSARGVAQAGVVGRKCVGLRGAPDDRPGWPIACNSPRAESRSGIP